MAVITLEDKSKENMSLVDSCLRQEQNLNAAAGRLYYAVFQKIKHLLQTEAFNYQAFLDARGLAGKERAYSHGTVMRALWSHLTVTRKNMTSSRLSRLGPMDELYNVRRTSDYEAGYAVSKTKLEWCYLKAVALLGLIDELRAEALSDS